MRVVLDTNVLIAAFVARGTCHELLEHCRRQHRLVTSTVILDEFERKLIGKFRVPRADAAEARALNESGMEIVAPTPLAERVSRDADDDWILATALTGTCDCIVTGDRDLLVLERFLDIPILTPSKFWRNEASRH